jgi:hypothetical protein
MAMDTARIERTMRVIEYEDNKPRIKRFLEEQDAEPSEEVNFCLIPEVPFILAGENGFLAALRRSGARPSFA